MRFFRAARRPPAPVVRRDRATRPPHGPGRAPRRAARRTPSGRYQSRTVAQVAARSSSSVEQGEVDPAADDAVLEVVHGVGHVVGEVHHLRLDAASRAVDARVASSRRPRGRRRRPRTCRRAVAPVAARAPGVLRAGVERRPGQVQPDRAAVGVGGLGLEPGQDAQRLGVALEAAAARAELVERHLAVVAERRVPHVVGERGGLGEVGVAAERVGQVAGDLGDLEAVGEPVAHEVVGLRAEHLGLRGQPAQRGGVHDPGPVALERRALRRRRPAWPAPRRGARGRPRRTARPRSRRRR